MRLANSETLADRIARFTVIVAIGAGALTAVGAGVLADRIVAFGDDTRLLGTAHGLVAEFAGRSDPEDIAAHLAEENEEAAPAGMQISFFSHGVWLPANASLPAKDGCGWARDSEGVQRRICVAMRGAVGVACALSGAQRESVRRAYVLGSLAAIALASVISLLLSRALARRAAAPLARLREAISEVSSDAPVPIAHAALEDSAEVSAIADTLNEVLLRLADSLAESRRFAAGAAHELRTPLTTMSAELELQQESLELPPAAREGTSRVQRALYELVRRVDRLLVLATSTAQILRDAVSINEVIESIVAALPQPNAARLSVTASEGMVRGDSALLEMMISNAIDNALKFSTGRVEIRVSLGEQRVIIEVADDGSGIAPSERARVFEPFYRAASRSDQAVRGYGLGLALIAHIAKTHGGSAAFTDPPQGTCLRIELPAWS